MPRYQMREENLPHGVTREQVNDVWAATRATVRNGDVRFMLINNLLQQVRQVIAEFDVRGDHQGNVWNRLQEKIDQKFVDFVLMYGPEL
jgi:hypothetical protein